MDIKVFNTLIIAKITVINKMNGISSHIPNEECATFFFSLGCFMNCYINKYFKFTDKHGKGC